MRKSLVYIFSAAISFSSLQTIAGPRKHFFFFQLSPNIQRPLQVQESPYQNIIKTSGFGLTFDAGYSQQLYRNLSLEVALGGNMYQYVVRSCVLSYNIPTYAIHVTKVDFNERPFALGLSILPTYHFNLGHTGMWRAGAGIKLIAAPTYTVSTGAQTTSDIGTTHIFYTATMNFPGGVKPAFTAFINKQLHINQAKLELGITANIYPDPMATGSFQIQSTYKNSAGTLKFYGSSLGINARLNLN
jgi:hypothetical protein